ncbi:TetR/AcrR family transcriptional regulator [Achromobacter insolitus]|uniref:HTH tetR-type domain-containing protein n=1 Tax=Achromobacter insolitus TaxID=217204 RepID=A0A6S7F6Y2_9BURK|nr:MULTISPECIES: TetR/AcrR family transcriptional regulator [Achromobacter]AVG41192.1 TetR/AcrR family transcriptional regulator [Achromobacter insolitus]AXA71869.1 TetR/AcrR family transcriptional regulator [Achromobacter insolitus]MCP1401361.1 AcrR family transcriptional regulator [Achromobacter insolitus]MDH3062686.1 TetR/AcrR family transcriptional regulator [Achromobacter insolitus]MEB3097774.1 TetR/AcrR family transcriptional regulator [Achromobacter sp. D10]
MTQNKTIAGQKAEIDPHDDIPTSLRFEEMLGHKSLDRSLPKRERTRYLFLTITARCVQEEPLRNPTVEFVLDQSGLSRGTFYNHFKDVDDCIFEMLSLFLEYIESARVSNSRNLSTYEAILEANDWYCRAYEANANLYAAVHRNAAITRLREDRNANWTMKVLHVSERRRGRAFTKLQRREYAGMIRILITMTIDTLRERFVNHDTLLTEAFPTASSLAAKVSDLWYRTMAEYEALD